MTDKVFQQADKYHGYCWIEPQLRNSLFKMNKDVYYFNKDNSNKELLIDELPEYNAQLNKNFIKSITLEFYKENEETKGKKLFSFLII